MWFAFDFSGATGMKINTGTPTISGRYACYLPGVGEATVIRIYLLDYGWFDNLHEKVSGPVAGWIGPLPMWPENSVRTPRAPVQEYDL